jgi:K+-transporting ATPase c subunit
MQTRGYLAKPAGTTTLVLRSDDARQLYRVLVRLLDEEGSSFDETVGVLSAAYQLARLLGARP